VAAVEAVAANALLNLFGAAGKFFQHPHDVVLEWVRLARPLPAFFRSPLLFVGPEGGGSGIERKLLRDPAVAGPFDVPASENLHYVIFILTIIYTKDSISLKPRFLFSVFKNHHL
jgi:hypothetical protein